MRIPRTAAAIISAIFSGGLALFMLTDPFYFGGGEGVCAGFFGLLTLYSIADYYAANRRERKRIDAAFGYPTRDQLYKAQARLIQRNQEESAKLTRKLEKMAADYARRIYAIETNPTGQLSQVEIAEQVQILREAWVQTYEEETQRRS